MERRRCELTRVYPVRPLPFAAKIQDRLKVVVSAFFGTARRLADRVPAYGLSPAEDDVPRSFFLQLLYPLSLLVQPRTPWTAETPKLINPE